MSTGDDVVVVDVGVAVAVSASTENVDSEEDGQYELDPEKVATIV